MTGEDAARDNKNLVCDELCRVHLVIKTDKNVSQIYFTFQ